MSIFIDFTYDTTSGNADITGISVSIPNNVVVTIPATVVIGGTTYNVAGISINAFKGALTTQTDVTLDLSNANNLTTIGGGAFYNCNGFTGSLTIPNSVTTIENSAFAGCYGFTGSLTIPNSVTTIEDSAFAGCHGFDKSVTVFPQTLNGGSISVSAFDSKGLYLNCDISSGSPINLNVTTLYSSVSIFNPPLPANLISSGTNPLNLNGTIDTLGKSDIIFEDKFPNQLKLVLNNVSPPCLLKGTQILVAIDESLKIYKNVEDIQEGDVTVSPFSGKGVKVKRLIKQEINWEALDVYNRPLRISKDAIDVNLPSSDLYISGHHRVIIKNHSHTKLDSTFVHSTPKFVGVQAFKISEFQDKFITLDEALVVTGEDKLHYYNIELEDPLEGIIASGLALESYVQN